MKTNEFIIQELKSLSIKEIKNLFSDKEQTDLLETITQVFDINGIADIEILSASITQNEKLSSLKILNFNVEQLLKVNDLDFLQADFQIIEQRMSNDPKNRIYPLLWILHKINTFETDEYLDSEYADFLKTVFEKYDFIVNLDDFLFESRILLIKPSWEVWEKEIFQPVFEIASNKYQKKYAFRKILAYVYFQNEDYKAALKCLEQIMNSIKNELSEREDKSIGDIEFPYFEYLDAVQLSGIIHYTLGDHEKAMQLLNFVINNLPKIEFENGEEDEILSYIDSFILRIHYNIQKNKTDDVIHDYKRIKEYLCWGDWENEYPDVFKYINDKNVA
ncbi:MAG: hypothetical protein GX660_18705 [Clostridiaceae bacterium]|nr:hypothetical protein [Clostridiaceae bacterium]